MTEMTDDGPGQALPTRRGVIAGLAAIGSSANAAPGAGDGPAGEPAGERVTIYHLEGRRSIRIIWLCEELGLPYRLMFKPGDPAASRAMLEEINPLMPTWPTVVYQGNVLMESGGIIEYILSQEGRGRLQPEIGSGDLPFHYQWLHFAEGTAMYRLWATRYASMVAGVPVERVPRGYHAGQEDPKVPGKLIGLNALVGPDAVFAYMDRWLQTHPYFGGAAFTAADIMMHFAAIGARLGGIDVADYPAFQRWQKKVEQRPAFIRARTAAHVDASNAPIGLPSVLPPLPPREPAARGG